MTESCSIGVIGAGISGMGAAFNLYRTSKRLKRGIKVTLFDTNPSAGGTWSTASVYKHLITNNSWSQMLLDDDGEAMKLFLSDPELGAGPGGFRATGEGMIRVMDSVQRQLLGFGATFHFETTVISISQPATGGWLVTSSSTKSSDKGKAGSRTQHFDKIIVAVGTFSTPSLPACAQPHVLGQRDPVEDLEAPIALHTSNLSGPSVQKALYAKDRKIVVVGASKSALDAAERLAINDYHVTLVLKNPPYLAPPAAKNPKTGELADAAFAVGTRAKTAYVPFYRDPISGQVSGGGLWASWTRYFLHSTLLGSYFHRRIVQAGTAVFASIGRWAHLPGMIPVTPLMFSESQIMPSPTRLQELMTDGKITLIKGSVVGMDPVQDDAGEAGYRIQLATDDAMVPKTVDCQAIIFGTGWNTGTYPFFTPTQAEELGLPLTWREDEPIPAREKDYEELDKKCLKQLLKETRTLREIPAVWHKPGFSSRSYGRAQVHTAPYRLFRMMVPLTHLNRRDIVFPGLPTCKANHVLFLVQAHWITDYLLDLFPKPLPNLDQARKEISTHVVWAKRLFGPSHGRLGNWAGAAWIEMASRLCWDMGVPDDGQGVNGVITSASYGLEEKRSKRDTGRGLAVEA